MRLKNIGSLLIAIGLLGLSIQPVFANANSSANINNNANQNDSGASATGGDSRNLNVVEGDTIDSESDTLVLDPIPTLNLQNIDQMIQTKLGTVNCAVEDLGGTEVRLGFPPAIVFKDQDVDGGDCMSAMNMLSKYLQADVLSNMIKYINTLDVSPEYKEGLNQDLTNQILDLFVAERELIEQKARTNAIGRLQKKLAEPKETFQERARKVLEEGKN